VPGERALVHLARFVQARLPLVAEVVAAAGGAVVGRRGGLAGRRQRLAVTGGEEDGVRLPLVEKMTTTRARRKSKRGEKITTRSRRTGPAGRLEDDRGWPRACLRARGRGAREEGRRGWLAGWLAAQ